MRVRVHRTVYSPTVNHPLSTAHGPPAHGGLSRTHARIVHCRPRMRALSTCPLLRGRNLLHGLGRCFLHHLRIVWRGQLLDGLRRCFLRHLHPVHRYQMALEGGVTCRESARAHTHVAHCVMGFQIGHSHHPYVT